MIAIESSSDFSTARGPPRTSAETYAASFHPPNVSSTNTIASPIAPTLESLAALAAGACAGSSMKPAAATKSSPPISRMVKTFCKREELRSPTMLTAVSKSTARPA